jgi:hypothetical protein
MVAITKPALKS